MKRIQTVVAYLFALAVVGVLSSNSAEPGKIPGVAKVQTVNGSATYSIGGGQMQLKTGMELPAGATISTGPDSVVYLRINGNSAVRVQENTTLAIPQMDRIGSQRQGDSETLLDLKSGTILGQVQKVSANSTYEIKTPHGVAGIRGTEFAITVTLLPTGTYQVTFTCVSTGTVIASAIVNGNSEVRQLQPGQSWTPGSGEPLAALTGILSQYETLIAQMMATIVTTGVTTVTQPAPQPYFPPSGEEPSGATSVGGSGVVPD